MATRQIVVFLACAVALLGASAASASIVVENVNLGSSGSEDVTIGGDTLILQTAPTFGPQSLHIYDSYYGGSYYANTFQGEALASVALAARSASRQAACCLAAR